MSQTQTRPNRILALDPTTKGFGYAILDLPLRLVAWGMAHVEGEKRSGAIFRFEALLDQFRPDAVVLEDTTAPGSRRTELEKFARLYGKPITFFLGGG
jgi:RNase H-fold protein (predicted Holliday junction resolvase)